MQITAELVKKLRDKTGAGIMNCKEALTETGGDLEKAVEYLRKKGIAAAEKRIGRSANEGIIHAYIHPGNRLGVIIEVNCETDFVARTDDFKNLVKDIAMQVAASNPLAIIPDQLPKDIVEREKEIYREQSKNLNKPEHILEKIVAGRLKKYYQEVCLLEQQYVKDPSKTVNDLIKEIAGKLGENIVVRRFVRFHLGEE